MSAGKWNAQRLDRYVDQLAGDMHDADCEQRERSSPCHCSKRRREARGLVKPPEGELCFPPPDCLSCSEELDFDGDSWTCRDCALTWGANGQGPAEFFDVYGDDIGGDRWGRRMLDLAREDGAA